MNHLFFLPFDTWSFVEKAEKSVSEVKRPNGSCQKENNKRDVNSQFTLSLHLSRQSGHSRSNCH